MMKTSISYRKIIFICTFLTGMTGLVFQVVWQKYLSYLVGSESRSMSLVVAVFLLGLASGYKFWGKLSEKITERYKLLKIYGYVELGIGAFAIIFPRYYILLEKVAQNSPNHMVVDLLVTVLAIFIPTFLMGATVPLLTAVVPESADEVNSCHARIYGINTLGAVLGALGGGFFFIPWLGLSMTLVVGGFINVVVGLILGGNQLDGSSQEKGEIDSLPNHLSSWAIYAFVFITGCICISFELLFMRIMSQTVGAGYYIFPLVVGIFVLGLAIGSLSLYRKAITLNRVFKEMLFLVGYISVLYLSIPYWPYWLHNLRASLTSVPTNYVVYMIGVTFFLAVFGLPLLVPLGRLLPVGYSLIDKNSKNYGRVCGNIYFINSLGTLVGSLIVAHYLLYWLDIDQIFKIVLLILAVTLLCMLVTEKQHKKIAVAAVLAVVALLLPKWDRYNHQIGLFRDISPKDYSFKGIFKIPGSENKKSVLFFDDDPNTSVTVLDEPIDEGHGRMDSLSIIVNGKSDSNTYGDYSTINLLSTIPYLYSSQKDLSAAVIGLGTGVSAGVLGAAQDVKSVVVLEISPAVIKAAPIFDAYSENMTKNPKIQVIESDAFRYFAKTDKKFDIILSEPSNPWVMGVENLFTPQFYDITKKALSEDGVFMQWTHLYSMNSVILATILDNLASEFNYLQLYAIGSGDLGILASMKPLNAPHIQKRWSEEIIKRRHQKMGLYLPKELDFLRLYSEKEIQWIGRTLSEYPHDSERPTLSFLSSWSFFLGHSADADNLILSDVSRLIREATGKEAGSAMVSMASEYGAADKIPGCEGTLDRRKKHICGRIQGVLAAYIAWTKADKNKLNSETLSLYKKLRQRGVIPADLEYLRRLMPQVAAPHKVDSNLALALAHELTNEEQWDDAQKVIDTMVTEKIIPQSQIPRIKGLMNSARKLISESMMEYRKMESSVE